ncbi:MAG: phosphoglycerate kinase [Chlamydiia bacterium]
MIRSLEQLPCAGQRVLVRVDFNVPMDDQGKILDDHRLRAALHTIQKILAAGGSCILLSHLGRPDGKSNPALSLAPIAKRLGELLHRPVEFVPEVVGPQAQAACQKLGPGELLLLENVRFLPGEEHPEQDPSMARQLASYGTAYVNDAFGTAHRAHTTVTELPKLFGDRAVAGDLMIAEVKALLALQNPRRPLVAILGGSKVSTKIGVLHALCQLCNTLCLGGVMAQTFLASRGLSMGTAPIEKDHLETARAIEQEAAAHGCKILLPVDLSCRMPNQSDPLICPVESVPPVASPLDIGPNTVQRMECEISDARTVFWNGPLGRYEDPPFDKGSLDVARFLASVSAYSIVGGGDTVAVVERAGVADQIDHVSTGGGASLELIEFGTLPGIEVLSK